MKWEDELIKMIDSGTDEKLAIIRIVNKYHKYELKGKTKDESIQIVKNRWYGKS